MTRNQTVMIGPKARPIDPVPRLCERNSAMMTTRAMGSTAALSAGETTSSPATAESTEMAGVIMPSPKNSPAPMMPTMPSAARVESERATRCARAMRARMPPSP